MYMYVLYTTTHTQTHMQPHHNHTRTLSPIGSRGS